ncbi:MAG: T9SS type A sorting domain-containing protein, partial [Bacteroidetes bacterium]|nr:T9SS type A sorting domain-containing protein [Bacteroidota bacterium]
MGRKALQGNTAGDAIPVNTLPPGMYLLRFMQGAVQQQIKFMKE